MTTTGPEPSSGPVAVVERAAEAEILEAALLSGAHVLLEGPPGTGKSTLLRQVAAGRRIPFVMVEGNAELTPARLIGHFDPALVLSKGYVPEIFEDGPLLEAMRTGGLLYVEELNRIPEETLNVLLTAMSELEITVPRLGRVAAEPGFALVAAMNPFDAVGTARVSGALYDRTCRISMDYQSAEAEQQIVDLRSRVDPDWRARVVTLVRNTRDASRHPVRLLGARRHRHHPSRGRARPAPRRPHRRLARRAGRGQGVPVGPDPAPRRLRPDARGDRHRALRRCLRGRARRDRRRRSSGGRRRGNAEPAPGAGSSPVGAARVAAAEVGAPHDRTLRAGQEPAGSPSSRRRWGSSTWTLSMPPSTRTPTRR